MNTFKPNKKAFDSLAVTLDAFEEAYGPHHDFVVGLRKLRDDFLLRHPRAIFWAKRQHEIAMTFFPHPQHSLGDLTAAMRGGGAVTFGARPVEDARLARMRYPKPYINEAHEIGEFLGTAGDYDVWRCDEGVVLAGQRPFSTLYHSRQMLESQASRFEPARIAIALLDTFAKCGTQTRLDPLDTNDPSL